MLFFSLVDIKIFRAFNGAQNCDGMDRWDLYICVNLQIYENVQLRFEVNRFAWSEIDKISKNFNWLFLV